MADAKGIEYRSVKDDDTEKTDDADEAPARSGRGTSSKSE
jgi:hypothetical protein